jgi:hypothetical protein
MFRDPAHKENTFMHPRSALVCLLLSAIAAEAQTLGAATGIVTIGRPLDIVVQSPGLAADDSKALCAQAEVRYGERRLAFSDVSIDVVREAANTGLRVQTRTPLDEPYATVEVQIGCAFRYTRRYTLLASLPDAQEPVVSASRLPAADTKSPAVNGGVAAPVRAAIGGQPTRQTAVAPRSESGGRPSAPAASSRRPAVVSVPSWSQRWSLNIGDASLATVGSAASRLVVEPMAFETDEAFLEFLRMRVRNDTSRTMGGSVDSASPAGEPAVSLASLQQELADLKAEREQLQRSIEGLNLQLSETEERYRDALVYGAISLAVLLAGMIFLGLRERLGKLSRRAESPGQPWWAKNEPGVGDNPSPSSPSRASKEGLVQGNSTLDGRAVSGMRTLAIANPLKTAAQAVRATASKKAVGDGKVAAPPKHDRSQEPQLAVPSSRQDSRAATPGQGRVEPSDRAAVALPPLDPMALHELWEQVDFLESLGQVNDAIEAIHAFVQASPGSTEAPYWRWWALAKSHGLPLDTLQAMYEQHFQRALPTDTDDSGLETDTEFLSALSRVWPTENAKTLINDALASRPSAVPPVLRVRTAAAFDDLVVLAAVLEELTHLPQAAMSPLVASAGTYAIADGQGSSDFDLPDITEITANGTTSVQANTDEGPLEFDLGDWHGLPADPVGRRSS